MPKLKIKVYFYHLFILAVVMLLCFYLMYKDMKRVESNMQILLGRCKSLEGHIMSLEPGKVDSTTSKVASISSDGGNHSTAQLHPIEVEVESDDDDEVNKELSDDCRPVIELKDTVDQLLEDMDGGDVVSTQVTQPVDLKQFSRNHLQSLKNEELKNYLKLKGNSVSGNKAKLIEEILALNESSPTEPMPINTSDSTVEGVLEGSDDNSEIEFNTKSVNVTV
jgi:hypothetical protein